ncbi:putative disease resistance RPP13-like protein 1 [Nicotiana tabacum]|uniref:Disease resistance RPP13-like protein 1 n=1 Tax=Nicotiana tabacum TaxID=4097 RepID=A0A1S4ANE7_TOBAC|nr:PREDICTED: putative disease resistance RPP13-like protein 1 [Nicotiana tabacum]
MAVAEVFLSAFITVLFEKLASGEILNFARKEGIQFQLKKWSRTLSKILAALADAEEKQITDKAVKLWLEDLRDLAYDLDDVLDEVSTEIFRRKMMTEFNSKRSKLQKLIPTCCTSLTPSTLKFNHTLESKLGKINSRLLEMAQQKIDLGLSENNGGRFSFIRMRERMPTTSLVDESRVYGREKDKHAILDLLLSNQGNCDFEACIIPIVGMGGVGKTTLAQLAYNDAKINDCFDLKIWVCVSEVFDVLGITNLIFESVAPESREIKGLDMLQVSLKEKLSKNRFLLVLDDVWNENYGMWDLLLSPLRVGLPGSKIVVTTRNEGVASVMSSVTPYRLKELASSDCLSLFCQHALGSINFDAQPDLRMIGERLVKKCKGLPLAAKTLGGLLRTKSRPKEWEDILNSKIWDLPEEKSDILPVLRLSYYHLPSDLKPLFAYCSIFPKDYEFDKDELILLWMGEGFLQQSEGKKILEELGDECFNELLSRSFFQHSSGNESRFMMHDLIHDLAEFVAGDICFRLDERSEGTQRTTNCQKARHSSYVRRQYEIFKRFSSLHAVQGLRTFLPLEVQKLEGWQKSYISKGLLDFLPKLRSLRILSLSGYCIAELPNSVGDLIHLRFLDLSETSIKQLPESICSLYNLQSLLLCGCYRLTKLPATLGNLINLRHLNNADTEQLQEMPTGIYKLTSLQTLHKMVLGRSNSLKLWELKSLSNLHGTLAITELQSVTDTTDAREADLASKKGIDELVMEFNKDFDGSRDARLEKDVLELLQPHGNLGRLSILFYGGIEYPSWISPGLLKSLTHLTLGGCRSFTLPTLGQLPLLAELYVHDMPCVKRVGTEFCGGDDPLNLGFPALEVLRFENLPEWEEWYISLSNAFPRLHELSICNCPKLSVVSLSNFPVLRELNLDECNVQVLRSIFGIFSVKVLKIRCVWGLSLLSKELTQYLGSLEDLDITECGDLISLWDGKSSIEHLSNLKNLGISKCPQLKCLSLEENALPQTPESLSICECSNFENLPCGFDNALSLRQLRIRSCPKIVSLDVAELSTMLKRVEIAHCVALETLPHRSHCLEELKIDGCPSLRSISTHRLPTTLKVLQIDNCRELASVSDTLLQGSSSFERLRISNWPSFTVLLRSVERMPTLFSCLVELHISRCDTLESFPHGCLPSHNLRSLSIWSCSNLHKLPDQIGGLTSLESLMLHDCTSLESFPEQELPPNLTSLWASSCHTLKPLSEWGLHKLTTLQKLTVIDGFMDLVSFPDDCVLPSSLTSLWLGRLCNLESLSKGLVNLSSLEHLLIRDCAKLRHLPNQELLDTISYLEIRGSPLLKEKCLKEKGEYWLKIANIPCVHIDGTLLHEQNS